MKKVFVGSAVVLGIFGVAFAATRNFDAPASPNTAQQFLPGNVQRQDTPNDPGYDNAEPDDQDGAPTTANLFDEQFYLFGFPSARTANTAIYKDGPHAGMPMVSGFNAAGAWKLERGSPQAVVAILDTGIKWDRSDLRTQVHLNCAELPAPQDANGNTQPGTSTGCKEATKLYDLDGNGAFNVDDYANDPRVHRPYLWYVSQGNPNGTITAEDLIKRFSDGSDDDQNGYVDDIAGWNFFNDDNDPFDRSSYFAAANHGSGRASEAVNAGNNGNGDIVGSSRVDLQACKLEYSIVSPK